MWIREPLLRQWASEQGKVGVLQRAAYRAHTSFAAGLHIPSGAREDGV